jgi:hypothetical protein
VSTADIRYLEATSRACCGTRRSASSVVRWEVSYERTPPRPDEDPPSRRPAYSIWTVLLIVLAVAAQVVLALVTIVGFIAVIR